MATVIGELFAAWQASLAAQLAPLGAVRFRTTDAAFKQVGAPPEVVFIHAVSSFGPPDKSRRNPRALWTESARVEVHLWGRTPDDVEAMKEAAIQTAHRLAFGSYSVDSLEPDEDRPATTAGHALVLTFTFAIPVLDRPVTTVVPTSFTVTPGTAGDGILESGET